ncbi:MAG: hypothetical protein R2795_20710 [Saprospiraceae bacterium]
MADLPREVLFLGSYAIAMMTTQREGGRGWIANWRRFIPDNLLKTSSQVAFWAGLFVLLMYIDNTG